MDRERNLEAQRRFVAEKQGQGLKRVVLWARPEDVGALKEIAGQPHAVAQHLAELRPGAACQARRAFPPLSGTGVSRDPEALRAHLRVAAQLSA